MWPMFDTWEMPTDLLLHSQPSAHSHPFSFHSHMYYVHICSVLGQVLCTIELKANKRIQGGNEVVRELPTSSFMTFGSQSLWATFFISKQGFSV